MKKETLEKLRDFHYDKWRHFQELLNDLTQKEYDDNRVYRTGERQLDTRIDGRVGRREAA